MTHAAAIAGVLPIHAAAGEGVSARPSAMGLVIYSLNHYLAQASPSGASVRAEPGTGPNRVPASVVLEAARRLFRAGGIQADIAVLGMDAAARLKEQAAEAGMFVEGMVAPPKAPDDEGFEAAVRATVAAGATVARTVLFPGRRYENFRSIGAFREAERNAAAQLGWAEPILRRHRLKLAVENHKDQTAAEKLRLLERFDSEWIGLCLDFGNNLALVERPLETIEALAPRTFTVHIKDQDVIETSNGFLLADAALGQGSLPLAEMVRTVRAVNPSVRFHLEVITRDALRVPIYTEAFWDVFPPRPAAELARFKEYLQARRPAREFPQISALPPVERVAAERENVAASFVFARAHLNL